MRVKRGRLIWHVVAVAAFSLLLSRDGLACQRGGPIGKKALEGAAAAFSGKVTRIEYLDADEPGAEPRIVVTFEVYRSWRGPLTRLLHQRPQVMVGC